MTTDTSLYLQEIELYKKSQNSQFKVNFFKDINFLKILHQEVPNYPISKIPDFVFEDENLAIEAMSFQVTYSVDSHPILKSVSNNKEAILRYLKNPAFTKDNFLSMVGLALWSDRDFCLNLPEDVLVSSIFFFSEDLLDDRTFILELANKAPTSLRLLQSEHILKDKKIALLYINNYPFNLTEVNKEITYELLQDNRFCLKILEDTLKYFEDSHTNIDNRLNVFSGYSTAAKFFNTILNHPNFINLIEPVDVFNKESFDDINNKQFKRFFHTTIQQSPTNFSQFKEHFEYLLDKLISEKTAQILREELKAEQSFNLNDKKIKKF